MERNRVDSSEKQVENVDTTFRKAPAMKSRLNYKNSSCGNSGENKIVFPGSREQEDNNGVEEPQPNLKN